MTTYNANKLVVGSVPVPLPVPGVQSVQSSVSLGNV